MKNGKTLVELATELERQKQNKRDFISPASFIDFEMKKECKNSEVFVPSLNMDRLGSFGLKPLAEEQVATRLGIPKKYYDKMKNEAPFLLEKNANHWLKNNDKKFMIRTLDDKARAFLSSRYRPLDNFELSEAVLPQLSKLDLNIESCEVTDNKMYIKAISPKITAEIQKGDVVQAGIVISNSEVGCGSVRIEPLIYRLICLNGMISADHSLRKYHVGRGRGSEEDLREYFLDETKKADDKAFWMKVRDIVKSSLGNDIFDASVDKLRKSVNNIIEAKPMDVVEVVQEQYTLSEGEKEGVLMHLIKGGDLNQYALVNAITRTSQDVEDYDRATDLERIGGEVLELKGRNWNKIASAG